MHIFGVHMDRKTTMPNVERIVAEIKQVGREAIFFNVNASDPGRRSEVLDQMEKTLADRGEPSSVKVMLHSLAFGTLKPFIAPSPKDGITPAQMEMTLDVMANSLVYWVQELVARRVMTHGGRVFAMTSSGGARVWGAYGAVSAAKASLESHIRQLAMELAPLGITANAIRAGVTDTPALRKIPGSESIKRTALLFNPSGRLTTPEDVAAALIALSRPETYWMTGNVIGVDGGEDIVGFSVFSKTSAGTDTGGPAPV
jgi:NAD(P)-dependent dehydrogenase (short-subunit alcohol dehydrogenase family)